MKAPIIGMFLALLMSTPTLGASKSKTFGLGWGETPEEIKGKGEVLVKRRESESSELWLATSLKEGISLAHYYNPTFYEGHGLQMVAMIGKSYSKPETAIKDANTYVKMLADQYNDPAENYDCLDTYNHWRRSDDLFRDLKKRQVPCYPSFNRGSDMGKVYLRLNSDSGRDAYLTITYVSDSLDEISEEAKKNKQAERMQDEGKL